jgi:hypothetical protein
MIKKQKKNVGLKETIIVVTTFVLVLAAFLIGNSIGYRHGLIAMENYQSSYIESNCVCDPQNPIDYLDGFSLIKENMKNRDDGLFGYGFEK